MNCTATIWYCSISQVQSSLLRVNNLHKTVCQSLQTETLVTVLKTHLMLRWEAPGALMAVHTEAALPRYPDQPRVGAGRWSWRQLVVAERSAANGTVDAGTLVFAARTEALAILVDLAAVLARTSLRFSWKDTHGTETQHLMTGKWRVDWLLHKPKSNRDILNTVHGLGMSEMHLFVQDRARFKATNDRACAHIRYVKKNSPYYLMKWTLLSKASLDFIPKQTQCLHTTAARKITQGTAKMERSVEIRRQEVSDSLSPMHGSYS